MSYDLNLVEWKLGGARFKGRLMNKFFIVHAS